MENGSFCIYPIYMDSARSISHGRKYPLSTCVPKPSLPEIVRALQELGIEHQADPGKRHPRDSFVLGRVQINKKYGKKYVVEGLSKAISDSRNKPKVEQKTAPKRKASTDSKNPLNLAVRKKKKKEKGKK